MKGGIFEIFRNENFEIGSKNLFFATEFELYIKLNILKTALK